MFGRRPVDESTVVHVLLIGTFTHTAVFTRLYQSNNVHCRVSRLLKQWSYSGEDGVGDLEFDSDFLTLRLLMSYIYMEHPFLMFLHHTQRRTTVGRTPLDE